MRSFGFKGGSRRRRLSFLGTLLVSVVALGALMISSALAVHETGSFELDGNAVSANALPPFGPADDWDRVCSQYASPLPTGGCGTTTATTGSTSGTWQSDGANATIFTGGGSKDPIDLSSWNWKSGAAPGKDDLLHAFAARYSLSPSSTCPAGMFPTCEVIFFGMDRFDNSGDATTGFWFFKSKIGLVTGKTNTFSGVHQNGDILVVSDFSVGGTTSTITVYKWDTGCAAAGKPDASCADSNLRQLESSTAANCATAAANDGFCGIVNTVDGTPVPWSGDYTDKSGNHSYLKGELYESGLNLSTLGLAGECFSSMVAESRSSTSTDSTLQDFVLANFPTCKPQLTTQASNNGTVLPGTAVHDTATITVTGGTSPPDPTGTVTFFLCGPSASNPTCTSDGTNIGTGQLMNQPGGTTTDGIAVATSPDVNTSTSKLAPGFYCFRATWPGDTNYPGGANGFTNADNTGECFRVQDTSRVSSTQHWVPNDVATATSDNGTPLNGTVTVQLYTGTGCVSGNEVSGHVYTKTVSGNTTSDTITLTTTNTDEFNSSVSWLVTFASSDPGVASPSSSHCENSSLTVTN